MNRSKCVIRQVTWIASFKITGANTVASKFYWKARLFHWNSFITVINDAYQHSLDKHSHQQLGHFRIGHHIICDVDLQPLIVEAIRAKLFYEWHHECQSLSIQCIESAFKCFGAAFVKLLPFQWHYNAFEMILHGLSTTLLRSIKSMFVLWFFLSSFQWRRSNKQTNKQRFELIVWQTNEYWQFANRYGRWANGKANRYSWLCCFVSVVLFIC